MARSKTPLPRSSTDPSLLEVVTQLADQVKELSGQVEVLRNAIDEIREEFAWAIRNDKIGTRTDDHWRPVMHVTSMPKDPLAEDFGDRLNRVVPADLPPPKSTPETSTSPSTPGELF
jgi:hypothetical protein